MKLGDMLGAGAAELKDEVGKWEKKRTEKQRARELARKRRLGKTIKYTREEDESNG